MMELKFYLKTDLRCTYTEVELYVYKIHKMN